ncbi:unnamed protein product [Strongylus vulgaris]|uniref:Uncharacterized protein n=1 Tax=Strongylus vulgaris TaxID=40348 RepID=A0A3P7KX02_STRVU|nr:unnamed protein product [Strongylus vulgaris]
MGKVNVRSGHQMRAVPASALRLKDRDKSSCWDSHGSIALSFCVSLVTSIDTSETASCLVRFLRWASTESADTTGHPSKSIITQCSLKWLRNMTMISSTTQIREVNSKMRQAITAVKFLWPPRYESNGDRRSF